MIEFKSINTYNGNFSYSNEASRKKDEQDVTFHKLIDYTVDETSDSKLVPEIQVQENQENDVNLIDSKVEVLTYNFFGEIINSVFYSGLSIDITI